MQRLTAASVLKVAALGGAVALALAYAHRGAQAEAPGVGTITYVKGEAMRASKGGAYATLVEKAKVLQGDRLKTGRNARLEATLADGSRLRLGEESELTLDTASFAKRKEGKKRVTARLVVGRVWAAVTSLFGSDSEFEVRTENAVAGVRGTRFSAGRDAAGTTTVKVYGGKVLVSNKPIYAIEGHTKGKRVEVPGPQEVSKQQWEELVAGAMQMVTVGQNGELSPAQSFALADPKADDWESWNSERDKLAGIGE